MLSVGAGLGILTLLLAWSHGTLTSLDLLPIIQTHANAQLFGWIGLFAMGFAYQGLPRFKYVQLWRPRAANCSLHLMLAGLALRMTGAVPAAWAPYTATAGAALEAAAAALFATVMVKTLSRSTVRDRWDLYVVTALAAFVAMGLAEPFLTYRSLTAAADDTKIRFTADFMAPYRNLQLFGFGAMLVLGVGQRILPTAFGFRTVGARACLGAWIAAVMGLAAGFVGWALFRGTGDRTWAIASWGGDLLFLASALWLAFELRGFTGGAPGRSRKFIRAAFWWLLGGALILAVAPLRMATLHAFPHGLYGAARHAIGLGFLSMMILGVSSKVVPILKGFDPAREPALWVPFTLITAGLALRILGQLATDGGSGAALALTAASGPLTALGFLVWGLHMWGLIGRTRPEGAAAAAGPRVAPDVTVAQIVDWYPATLEVFESFGFRELKNPLLRNTIGRRTTIRAACSMKNVDLDAFVAALTAKLRDAKS